jgi:hypothetical protein
VEFDPPAEGVEPSKVHQKVVFESLPGFDPLGVETLVLRIVMMFPETDKTGATEVIDPFEL